MSRNFYQICLFCDVFVILMKFTSHTTNRHQFSFSKILLYYIIIVTVFVLIISRVFRCYIESYSKTFIDVKINFTDLFFCTANQTLCCIFRRLKKCQHSDRPLMSTKGLMIQKPKKRTQGLLST